MSSADQRARYLHVTAGARVFALIVLAGPVAVSQHFTTIVLALLVAATWMLATLTDGIRHIPPMPALVVEASVITFIAAFATADSTVLLPAIVIPPFIAGLVRGSRGAFEVLGAEIAVLVATILPSSEINMDTTLAAALFTWVMAGLGCGLIAAIVHKARSNESTTVTSYRDARELITQLLDLSGELVDGLDPVSISENILDLVREEMPVTGAVIYTKSALGLSPLIPGDALVTDDPGRDELVAGAFNSGAAQHNGRAVAIPLKTDASVVAVIAAGVGQTSSTSAMVDLRTALTGLGDRLRPEALQLDTALLFSTVKEEATAEERRRLARDLHDGVAQDMASLGYAVDELIDSAEDEERADLIRSLRTELTRIVGELRRSVFLLRNESGGASSLGDSVRALAQHIESRSGIRVEVDVDEGSKRLRPDVEAELLRIIQEGMNNAVKHARATRIQVSCRVHAPSAQIRVTDNGRGLQTARDDSHGIRIMRERARRIGALLDLSNAGSGHPGAELRVVLEPAARPEGLSSRTEGKAS